MASKESPLLYPPSLIAKIIEGYKNTPCLWDVNHPDYKNRGCRSEAIRELTKLAQRDVPGVTRVHILRKLESLRAGLRRELKKVNQSRKLARRPYDVYEPTLWYYKLFSFLIKSQELPLPKFEEQNENSTEFTIQKTESGDEEYLVYEEDAEEYLSEIEASTSDMELSVDPGLQDLSTQASEELESRPKESKVQKVTEPRSQDADRKRSRVEIDDQYDAVGLIVASKLRALQPNMRIIAEKLINDVLYQAQINGLNSSSTIDTPDPFK